MGVPRYQDFIDPVLRCLADRKSATPTRELHEAAARALRLDEEARQMRVPSGRLTYKNRIAWALNTLKHAGFAVTPEVGIWEITDTGTKFAQANPALTIDHLSELVRGVRAPGGNFLRQPGAETVGAKGGTRGHRKAYWLPPNPFAAGGQANIYEAKRKSDGKVVVMKRLQGKSGEQRMRREIEIQSSLEHENIMPILDWDTSALTWYVMPKGARVMSQLPRPVAFDTLLQIVKAVASGLAFAHAKGHPHRDVKPQNIIELVESGGASRWVLADWGLTRRPLGETITPLTRTGAVLGTDGFAPPEAYQDAHDYGEAGDVFALGQVIAWATGATPVPNVAGNASGPWKQLVESMTKLSLAERIQTVPEVQSWLEELASSSNPKGRRAGATIGEEPGC
jgi:hypothetical protein